MFVALAHECRAKWKSFQRVLQGVPMGSISIQRDLVHLVCFILIWPLSFSPVIWVWTNHLPFIHSNLGTLMMVSTREFDDLVEHHSRSWSSREDWMLRFSPNVLFDAVDISRTFCIYAVAADWWRLMTRFRACDFAMPMIHKINHLTCDIWFFVCGYKLVV